MSSERRSAGESSENGVSSLLHMGLLGDLGLSAAQKMRSRLGTRAALRLLRPMITAADPSPIRAAAILVAFECAIDEGDEGAFTELARLWKAEPSHSNRLDVNRLCQRLSSGPRASWALVLADAEVARGDNAASRALRAAAREALSEIDAALEDLREAARLAHHEDDRAAADAARLELIRLLAARPASRLEAVRVAREVEKEPTSKRALLALSIARLGESGRYARVRGLDTLSELMRDSEPAIANAALDALLAHVDESDRALTEIELERVRDAIGHWPHASERSELASRFERVHKYLTSQGSERSALLRAEYEPCPEILARAQSVLDGHDAGPEPQRKDETWIGLAAIAALGRGHDEDAKKRLEELSSLALEGAPSTWTAAWMGLDHLATREAALKVAHLLLRLRSSPPRGFLAFATHLEHAQAPHLALVAIERAEARREKGARERRIDTWRRAAWDAHRRGERDEAIRCLRHAKV